MTHSKVRVGELNLPTLLYVPDGFSTSGEKLMGRQAAGEGFLRGFVGRHPDADMRILCRGRSSEAAANEQMKSLGHTGNINALYENRLSELEGVLNLPTPGVNDFAWRRLRCGERKFSISGVTHTTASHQVMQDITGLLSAPVREWDALVCTSSAVRYSVNSLLQEQAEYLRWRMGASRFELPQLPVIPLGVNTSLYAFTDAQRISARGELGIAEADVVLLFVGRLSFHAKAHPHPMFAAAQELAKDRLGQVHIVQCGWYANGSIEAAFNSYQQLIAPNVKLHTLDGREASNRQLAWSCADIFISLSDNIQETFGLTPIEAMAAGLPVIVSDWNGYKDTIVHGENGFRVATLAPPAGDGDVFAQRYESGEDSYDMYCGHTCEFVGVDVAQLVEYLRLLADDPALRAKLGKQAKQRAVSRYEWQQVIAEYEELWQDLDKRRLYASELYPGQPPLAPAHRPDPFALYSQYPTTALQEETELQLERMIDKQWHQSVVHNGVHSFASKFLPSWDECERILGQFELGGALTAGELLEQSNDVIRDRQVICWLHKMGTLSFKRPTV